MTECMHCHADLSKVKEIHAVQGDLFCSEECAIEHIARNIIRSAHDMAHDVYSDCAETVLPSDIGLTSQKKYRVEIMEISTQPVVVRADSIADAINKVEQDWNDGKIILDASDFDSVHFSANEVTSQ